VVHSAGSTNLQGSGTLELDGANQWIVPGDFNSAITVNLYNSSQLQVGGNCTTPVNPHNSAAFQVSGIYTVQTGQSLTGTFQAAGLVVATNGALLLSGATLNAPVDVQAGGQLVNRGDAVFSTNVTLEAGSSWTMGDNSATITLNGVLTNRGDIYWNSAYQTFNLQGSGWVENEGMFELGGHSGWNNESWFHVPMRIAAGSTLQLDASAWLAIGAGSGLGTVEGTVSIGGGGRLRLDNVTPPWVVHSAGSTNLQGSGTLELDGANQWIVPGDFNSAITVNLYNSAQLQVTGNCTAPVNPHNSAVLQVGGVYTVRSSQSLTGTFQAAGLVVATNGALLLSGATLNTPVDVQAGGQLVNRGDAVFSTNVTLEAGSSWTMGDNSATITLNGALTNRGNIYWNSAYQTFNLQGSGWVENEGLFELGGHSGWNNESWFHVPMSVAAGATLQLDNSAWLVIGAGSSLDMAGTLNIGSSARLRLDSSSPPRDFTFLPGSVWLGSGTVQIQGSNRAVFDGDVTLNGGLLNLIENSSLAGTNLLTIANGAAFGLDHSLTFPGSITVDGALTLASSSVTFAIQGALTLDASGTLNNPGAIVAGAFVNNGGVINGHAPALHPLVLRIIRAALPGALPHVGAETDAAVSPASRNVVLDCLGAPGQPFTVETSLDLVHWRSVEATCQETSLGHFRVSASAPEAARSFFRLRQAASAR